MNADFHYYATYAAAILAGYSHSESITVCTAAQMVDCCTRPFLSSVKAPLSAATTQSQKEMADARIDPLGLQDITRIWSSFHFLPRDLYAEKKHCGRRYRNKFRLICGPNGELLKKTVELAKGKGPEAAGLAMHVLADTWAHMYFAGTPSLVINNTNYHFYELLEGENGEETQEQIVFHHNPVTPDNLEERFFTNTIFQSNEYSVMSLGHGRAGHLPDYGFMRYKYLPAWGEYEEIIKDNPSDYMHAFSQMVYALRYLRGDYETFETDTYDEERVAPHREEIRRIIKTRRLDASEDWQRFGEQLSGRGITPFSLEGVKEAYRSVDEEKRDETFLGRFILAALAQKSMVTGNIFRSGSLLAGYAVDYSRFGFRGIKDFVKAVEYMRKENRK